MSSPVEHHLILPRLLTVGCHPLLLVPSSSLLLSGLSVPLVVPPMLGASGGKLAGAVSRAGGLGFVAWTRTSLVHPTPRHHLVLWLTQQASIESSSLLFVSPPQNSFSAGPAAALSSELALARQIAGPFSSLGVGVQLWQLDARGQEGLDVFATIAAATEVRSLWLFAGDWKRWVEKLRELGLQAGLGEPAAKDIWLQVGSVEEAKEALESKLVDVLVVQGEEGVHHSSSRRSPLRNSYCFFFLFLALTKGRKQVDTDSSPQHLSTPSSRKSSPSTFRRLLPSPSSQQEVL